MRLGSSRRDGGRDCRLGGMGVLTSTDDDRGQFRLCVILASCVVVGSRCRGVCVFWEVGDFGWYWGWFSEIHAVL